MLQTVRLQKGGAILTSYASRLLLLPRIYKELKTLNFKKANNTTEEWKKAEFSKDKIQIAEKKFECSTTLTIRETQIKALL